MTYPEVPRAVLVTGCSTGIGRATAIELRRRGWRVFATARTDGDLDGLRRDGLEAVRMDVTDTPSVTGAVDGVLAACEGKLGALVNNAGFGQPGALEDLSREALRRQFDVNVFGPHDVILRCLPAFLKQKAGRIVNVSSVLGRVTMPFLGAYCASKHALESLSDALRVELVDTGIAVSLIEPGPIVSAFRASAGRSAEAILDMGASRFGAALRREVERRRSQKKREGFITKGPEAVARKVVHALESCRPRRRYCVTIPAYLGAWARRILPDAAFDAAAAPNVRKMRNGG